MRHEPTRAPARAATLGLALALAAMPGFAQKAPDTVPKGPGSLAGIWQSGNSWRTDSKPVTLGSLKTPERDRALRTADGQPPPLQPWAAAVLDRRVKASQAGEPEALTLTRCLPGMPVLMLGGPYPIQLLETPDQIAMLFEEQNHFRVIRINGKHPDDPDPTFLGDSIGHWEGDTLVVDTIALNDQTPIDRVGTPHSDALHLIERYRRVDRDTLEAVVTFDDPKAFTRRWEARVTYHPVPPGVSLTEYICENNRDDPGK
jgi:hypothetical protein